MEHLALPLAVAQELWNKHMCVNMGKWSSADAQGGVSGVASLITIDKPLH